MKRIVRLNAVENICPEGILGMNQYSWHSNEGLSPQKLIICGVSFASPIVDFLNTVNINIRNSLFKLKAIPLNIEFNNLLLRKLLNKLGELCFFAFYSFQGVLSINLTYHPFTLFDLELRVANLLRFFSHRDCEFMCEKVVYIYEDRKTATELTEGYQMELLWEGNK